jgi:hypothetical protein
MEFPQHLSSSTWGNYTLWALDMTPRAWLARSQRHKAKSAKYIRGAILFKVFRLLAAIPARQGHIPKHILPNDEGINPAVALLKT